MSQVPLDAPETNLSAITDNAIRNSMGVANIRSRISVLLGSLRGAEENDSEDAEKALSPDGSLNQLHVVLSETESSVLALQSDIDELFSLLCSVADD
ncbi:TPA: hypothetical protein ACNH3S_000773 [Klebsiella pneumoniae]|uniref:hypothetical protein n=1 Tax=Klebsiella TaxID=570 RepID=UPI0010E0B37A|nr:hypothetical protein [Klebsiella pneumoniae]HBR8097474.1 hypothetical protein [Klebsiella variicola subsp. variicola]HCI6175120.1 hypothetical protein [Klebsiella quasipneumoniae subsp. quasipneumoniae]HCQ8973969.1 hypothetical protein [Klebsiella variicola]VTM84865.1 Uncharacterised protein [Klebsiella pneumoniae]HBS3663235.1 hypothetical protein [Klebsiella variicola subsp. variicola]